MKNSTAAQFNLKLPSYPDFSVELGDEGFLLLEASDFATNSMATNSAASPIRRLVLIILVYPPGRSLNRAATSPKSFDTTSLLRRKLNARRRAGKDPSLPNVIIRSVKPLISFAFASVVSILSCSRSDVTKLLNSAQRCLVCLPSCLPFFL